jgi:DNA-binding NarL/FixJ family response regulator
MRSLVIEDEPKIGAYLGRLLGQLRGIVDIVGSLSDAKEDVIDGLNSGADDYLGKPFEPQEFCCTSSTRSERSTRTTRAPSRASRNATSRPMPCAAPVTTAVLPTKRSG